MRLCTRYQKIDKIFRIKEDKFNYRDIIRWPTHAFAIELHYVLLFCISLNCRIQFRKRTKVHRERVQFWGR